MRINYCQNFYKVVQHYFGRFDSHDVICHCQFRTDAERVANVFSEAFSDRPFEFTVERLFSFDDLPYDPIIDETIDELRSRY